MFGKHVYYGIDLQEAVLREGLSQFPDAVGLVADLTRLPLPQNCADIIVSTNTLEHMSEDDQCQALHNLARILKPGGRLFLNKHLDATFDAVLQVLREEFAHIEVVYYRNPISGLFESCIERSGHLSTRPGVSTRVLAAIARCLRCLEPLTRRFSALNRCAYIRCGNKKGGGPTNVLDLATAVQLESNLFRL